MPQASEPTPSEIREMASAARISARSDSRSPTRIRPREPHERYDLPVSERKKDMDYFMVSLSCRGEPNPALTDHFRAGWEPSRAEDYPTMSGYGVEVNKRLLALNHVKEVGPDDPVIDRGLMLCERPKSISRQSRAEDTERAKAQVDNHMARLQNISRRAIGEKTQISRQVERSVSPPSDMIPDDVGMEE